MADKRRTRGDGGLHFRESDKLWIGTAYIVGPDGQRHQKRVASKTKTGAADKLRTLQSDIRRGKVTYGRKKASTVGEWLDYWLTEVKKPKVAPTTYVSYGNTIRLYLKPHLGTVKLEALTPAHIRAALKAVSSTRAQQKAYQVLRSALRQAVRDGLIERDATSAVDKPSHKPRQRGAFDSETAVHILKVAAARDDAGYEPKLASRWAAAFMTGARRGELLGLEWGRTDLEAGVIDIQWQLQRLQKVHGCDGPPDSDGKYPCGRVRPSACPLARWDFKPSFEYRDCHESLLWTRPKSKAGERFVPLAPPLIVALRMHRDMTAGMPNPHNLVWHHSDGRPISQEDDQREWDALMAAAGVPRSAGVAVLHEARNTAATRLLEAGVDVKVIQEILGHASILQTRDYQRVSLDLSKSAVANLGVLLPGDD